MICKELESLMKKLLIFVLALCCLVSATAAAENIVCDTTDRQIMVRTLQPDGTLADNPVIEGVSSVTGLPWEGRYMPVLCQIDNTDGGIGARAPWGASKASIVYEAPLNRNGANRMTFLFADEMPEFAGPVRSARPVHLYLRQEWGGGLAHWGGPDSNTYGLKKTKKDLGVSRLQAFFDGTTGGKAWNEFMGRVQGLASPHNAYAGIAQLQNLLGDDIIPTNHTFLFTDEIPEDRPAAVAITVTWKGDNTFDSYYLFNEETGTYDRFSCEQPYVDKDNGEQLSFANVIVQRSLTSYGNGGAAPYTYSIGCGNADIFQGGHYIAGYWMHLDADSRTVYFDENGNELKLLRGKTFILLTGDETLITYEN